MITRAKRRTNFTMMSNVGLTDERLSWKARGLLAYLLSKPDDWSISERQLATAGPDGRDAVRTALAELSEHGYIKREKIHDEKGHILWVSWISDEPWLDLPTTENPTLENPTLGEPTTENPTIINTIVTKTDPVKTEQQPRTDNKKKKEASPPHPMTETIKDAYVRAVGRKLPPSAYRTISPDAKFAAEEGFTPSEIERTYGIMKLEEYWKDRTIPLRVVLDKIANTKDTMRSRKEDSDGEIDDNGGWSAEELAALEAARAAGDKELAGRIIREGDLRWKQAKMSRMR